MLTNCLYRNNTIGRQNFSRDYSNFGISIIPVCRLNVWRQLGEFNFKIQFQFQFRGHVNYASMRKREKESGNRREPLGETRQLSNKQHDDGYRS